MILRETMNDGYIFKTIASLNDERLAWLTSDLADKLDEGYYFQHSGAKTISGYFNIILGYDESTAVKRAAYHIIERFADNWNHIYQVYFKTEYNPVENYDSTETEKVNSKIKTTSGNDSNVYGFNSTKSVPTSETNMESVTEGSADDNVRELRRHGNIGVTTTQQMMQSELVMRQYDFVEEMYQNVDKIMCSHLY